MDKGQTPDVVQTRVWHSQGRGEELTGGMVLKRKGRSVQQEE